MKPFYKIRSPGYETWVIHKKLNIVKGHLTKVSGVIVIG
jgi:hypothetical protein